MKPLSLVKYNRGDQCGRRRKLKEAQDVDLVKTKYKLDVVRYISHDLWGNPEKRGEILISWSRKDRKREKT